jgi:hypothetical protein
MDCLDAKFDFEFAATELSWRLDCGAAEVMDAGYSASSSQKPVLA